MENKVKLYGSDDNKIGETYFRRAKQLVKQQRAVWVGDDQKAAKFLPGADETYDHCEISTETGFGHTSPMDDEKLFLLARKRLEQRKLFWAHSVLLIPGILFAWLMAAGVIDEFINAEFALFFLGLSWGVWITAYAIHLYVYVKHRRPKRKNERWLREIAAEVETIKSEMAV